MCVIFMCHGIARLVRDRKIHNYLVTCSHLNTGPGGSPLCLSRTSPLSRTLSVSGRRGVPTYTTLRGCGETTSTPAFFTNSSTGSRSLSAVERASPAMAHAPWPHARCARGPALAPRAPAPPPECRDLVCREGTRRDPRRRERPLSDLGPAATRDSPHAARGPLRGPRRPARARRHAEPPSPLRRAPTTWLRNTNPLINL
jgi:hypothetical protein